MRFIKKFSGVFIVLTFALVAIQYQQMDIHAFSSGSPGGRTGSPGDGQTCRTCHSGAAPTTLSDAIDTDIPAEGYTPGETYNITASISEQGRSMFGFELTSETENRNKQGQWIVTNASQNRLTNSNSAVTHSSGGRSGSGSKTWQMQWKAPEVNVGAITFYAALMAANGNGGNSGDNLYVAQKTVQAKQTTSVKNLKEDISVELFPNPVTSFVTLRLPQDFNEDYGVYLIDAGGVVRAFYENQAHSRQVKIDVSQLASGNYFLRIFSDNFTASKPFVKS